MRGTGTPKDKDEVSFFEVEMEKSRNLSASEIEASGHGKGVSVYVTLIQSDTVQEYGHTKADTSPVGVGPWKKTVEPKDLSASERGLVMGRVWVCMLLCCSQIQYNHMVAQ